MPKPKVAFYWCASCGGCEETVVDLAEDILGVVEAVDIVLWPVAMDFKYKDIEAMPDKSITATLLNGAIRSTEQEEMARLLRRKSQFLIAYGSCAVSGGIPGLANQFPREQILKFNYEDAPDPGQRRAEDSPAVEVRGSRPRSLPARTPQRRPRARPGRGGGLLRAGLSADAEHHQGGHYGAAGGQAAAQRLRAGARHRPVRRVPAQEVQARERQHSPNSSARTSCWRTRSCASWRKACVCMGPATRSGCGAQCTTGNMPCTGCFGPTSRVRDQGLKIMSSLCANVAPKEEGDIDKVLAGIPDPIGTFYRYGLAKSLLRRKVNLPANGK